MEVSSTSINVARVTVMAMTQGFRRGFQAAFGAGWGRGRASAAAALIRKLSVLEARRWPPGSKLLRPGFFITRNRVCGRRPEVVWCAHALDKSGRTARPRAIAAQAGWPAA